MDASSDICALIPAFNEEAAIGEVVKKVSAHLDTVLVIDDGSSDHTSEAAQAAGAVTIRLEPNQGKGAAIKAGFKEAGARNMRAVVCMDADGQHDPNEIPLFLNAQDKGDIILGCRMSKTDDMPFVRACTNRFMSWLISKYAGQRILDTQCGYRMIKQHVWESVTIERLGYDMESEFLIKASRQGFQVHEVPIATIYNQATSDIHPIRDTIRFFHMLWRIRK